ncbi:MAG TPA: type III-B CRISPR module RAMP protein Cmr1 [Candidatus Dormibacteraeota bacterium]|nr:type III-B CRISPR module RAMP protein Cmr1 [Candidatus Dormibacteraeota bacterium]
MSGSTRPTVTARPRATRGGPPLSSLSVQLEVVTPILGGGSQAREIDEVEVIRPATVRGHLRFWWRALRGHEFEDAAALHAAESALWGRAADERGGRSPVELRVDLVGRPRGKVTSNIDLSRPEAYALWPARAQQGGTPPAPRYHPGTRFRLTLTAPAEREAELQNVVRAWVLFGGYGSRTRRGLGSLTVVEEAERWLPREATRKALAQLFGRDLLAGPHRLPVDTPWLAGAALRAGHLEGDPVRAWTTALGWLREFRQGTSGPAGERAREPGSSNRPSVSNWPEADKVRHLTGKTKGHPPRHNAVPAWPRAGFGLPIGFHFKDMHGLEPGDVRLIWQPRDEPDPADRLASPLITKALPLAGGSFAPCALWLHRAHPQGVVVLEGIPASAAPFDRLVAPGDQARFRPLVGKSDLRAAFLDWLDRRHRPEVVAQ